MGGCTSAPRRRRGKFDIAAAGRDSCEASKRGRSPCSHPTEDRSFLPALPLRANRTEICRYHYTTRENGPQAYWLRTNHANHFKQEGDRSCRPPFIPAAAPGRLLQHRPLERDESAECEEQPGTEIALPSVVSYQDLAVAERGDLHHRRECPIDDAGLDRSRVVDRQVPVGHSENVLGGEQVVPEASGDRCCQFLKERTGRQHHG